VNQVNMYEVFLALDKRKAQADAIIKSFTDEQVAEASRVARLYRHYHEGSVSHKEAIVEQLQKITQ